MKMRAGLHFICSVEQLLCSYIAVIISPLIVFISFSIVLGSSADASNLTFTSQVQLSPVTQLPANITFVPEGDSGTNIEQVRALLVLDGELLAIKLQKDVQPRTRSQGPEFRGTFPSPNETITYQFQIIYRDGKAELTNRFEVSPGCRGYQISDEVDRETKILALSQQQKKRLETARDLIKIELKKLNEE